MEQIFRSDDGVEHATREEAENHETDTRRIGAFMRTRGDMSARASNVMVSTLRDFCRFERAGGTEGSDVTVLKGAQ